MIKDSFSKINSFIKKNKLGPLVDVALFSIIIVFFHFLWWDFGLKSFLYNFASFDQMEQFMAKQVFLASSWFDLHVLGYNIRTLNTTIYFPDINGYIEVNGSCSGLKQFYQWTVLMLLFPGPWKHKLWYIPLGIFIIHLNNILRIIILSVIIENWPDYWHFAHDWILRPFFYVIIFTLWVIWVEKIRPKYTSVKTQ
ncbi:MAG TPA: archaeosortase/exosortase family protein [Bacteroidales bacterium]